MNGDELDDDDRDVWEAYERIMKNNPELETQSIDELKTKQADNQRVWNYFIAE